MDAFGVLGSPYFDCSHIAQTDKHNTSNAKAMGLIPTECMN